MRSTFSYNLKLLRTASELSGRELSEKLCLDGKRINNLELYEHKPTADEIKAIAKCFDVTMDHLLYRRAKIVFEE